MREELAQGCDLKARRPEVNTRGLELMLGRREADVRGEQMSYPHIEWAFDIRTQWVFSADTNRYDSSPSAPAQRTHPWLLCCGICVMQLHLGRLENNLLFPITLLSSSFKCRKYSLLYSLPLMRSHCDACAFGALSLRYTRRRRCFCRCDAAAAMTAFRRLHP